MDDLLDDFEEELECRNCGIPTVGGVYCSLKCRREYEFGDMGNLDDEDY